MTTQKLSDKEILEIADNSKAAKVRRGFDELRESRAKLTKVEER